MNVPPSRRLTRAEAKQRTREQLLDSAANVFARNGFAGASVEEIAESAGYSTGALYSNFDSKEQLFLELLATRRSRGTARRVHAIAEILDDDALGEGDPFEALARFFVGIADRRPELAVLQAELWLYAVRHPEAMHVIAAALGEQVDTLESVVVDAMARTGASSAVSPRAVTTVAVAMVQGLVRQRRIDRSSVPDDLFAQALRWLFAGVGSST